MVVFCFKSEFPRKIVRLNTVGTSLANVECRPPRRLVSRPHSRPTQAKTFRDIRKRSPYGGCVYPNAKAFGYGEHVCIQMRRHSATGSMCVSKCEGIRLRGTCVCPNAKAFGYGEHVCVQMRRHSATGNMCVYPNGQQSRRPPTTSPSSRSKSHSQTHANAWRPAPTILSK